MPGNTRDFSLAPDATRRCRGLTIAYPPGFLTPTMPSEKTARAVLDVQTSTEGWEAICPASIEAISMPRVPA
ncbi:MAG: hypothetical protein BWX47_02108 [candidate division Hyd24-12 bacterium ADurb.Bin004]|nr:MAG: hypothetical protein BWX47_02108 [candidate division Hyd24-12 bacterium ADurb.Bin004]